MKEQLEKHYKNLLELKTNDMKILLLKNAVLRVLKDLEKIQDLSKLEEKDWEIIDSHHY